MRLTSPAFEDGSTIPSRYCCGGDELSPPLHIEGVPHTAQALALVVDDPDLPDGGRAHWILWNISADATDLPEGLPEGETVPGLAPAAQGLNDFGRVGYSAPCPPDGEEHRYRFRLYALGEMLNLNPGSDRTRFEEELDGKVVAEVELSGSYRRS